MVSIAAPPDQASVRSRTDRGGERGSAAIRTKAPFDLPLSLAAAASFLPIPERAPPALMSPILLDGAASVVKIWQPSLRSSLCRVCASPSVSPPRLRRISKWLISADLDLRPFYELASPHPILGPVAASLRGLKPLRPSTLFEMAIIAITEQQLSLAAAFHIRSRLLNRFGTEIAGFRVFPSAARLDAAALEELSECGLSRRKAGYVKELARRLAAGALSLEALKSDGDAAIREVLLQCKGFGEWSVQYILARGYGRPDCLPAADAGLRSVAGVYFADGRKLTAAQLEEALAPFKPYRSLAAYYLAVHWRLRRRRGQARD